MKIKLSADLLHSIQLKKVKLIKMDCENINLLDKINPENVDMKFNTEVNELDKKGGKLRLEVIIQEENHFKVVIKYEGHFIVREDVNDISEDELKFFLEIQAIPLLLSYVRETMNNTFVKMEIDMNMPVIDMNQIYANYLEIQD